MADWDEAQVYEVRASQRQRWSWTRLNWLAQPQDRYCSKQCGLVLMSTWLYCDCTLLRQVTQCECSVSSCAILLMSCTIVDNKCYTRGQHNTHKQSNKLSTYSDLFENEVCTSKRSDNAEKCPMNLRTTLILHRILSWNITSSTNVFSNNRKTREVDWLITG